MISRQLLSSYFKRYEPEFWMYTVDTTKLDSSNTKTSIPFDLYNVNDAKIKVEWGDDTTSTYTKTDYSSSTALNSTSSIGLIHTYSEPGVYTVKVISDDFDKVKLYNSSSASTNAPIYYYRNTITEVKNAFPTLNVTDFEYCFYNCTSLTSIPSGLFDNNTAVTTFYGCFAYCTSLTTIPSGLFDNNTTVNDFQWCFRNCSSLTSIPQDLFKYNTAITNFNVCFSDCSSLTTIPTNIFKYNTAVDCVNWCFSGCSSLNDFTIHIGSTLVTTASSFVDNKSGTTRTVYVPNNSTTKTTFEGVASSLGLTIIGE